MKLEIDLFAFKDDLEMVEVDNKTDFKDSVRKKNILLQPEELVRQLWLRYLHLDYGIAFASMAVEKSLKIGEQDRRYDLVIYDKADPKVLFEFKRFSLPLNQEVCQQIAQYNLALKIPYLVISNGQETFAFEVNHRSGTVLPLTTLPFNMTGGINS